MTELTTTMTRQVEEEVSVPVCDECGTEAPIDDPDVAVYESGDEDPDLHYHRGKCLEAASVGQVSENAYSARRLEDKHGNPAYMVLTTAERDLFVITVLLSISAYISYAVALKASGVFIALGYLCTVIAAIGAAWTLYTVIVYARLQGKTARGKMES